MRCFCRASQRKIDWFPVDGVTELSSGPRLWSRLGLRRRAGPRRGCALARGPQARGTLLATLADSDLSVFRTAANSPNTVTAHHGHSVSVSSWGFGGVKKEWPQVPKNGTVCVSSLETTTIHPSKRYLFRTVACGPFNSFLFATSKIHLDFNTVNWSLAIIYLTAKKYTTNIQWTYIQIPNQIDSALGLS